jgi:ribonucleotide monophosphatase NagD (HAD superfamily)
LALFASSALLALYNINITTMEKKGFLIDMDGVIYRGSEPIPGAVEFINHLRDKGYPFLF